MAGCIVYTGIMLLLLFIPLFFSFLFSLQCLTLKIFITLFSGTVRLRRLKHGTHVDSGKMYRVYRNQAAAAAAYSSLYYSPALKKWGLYWICLVPPSFCDCHSVTFQMKIFRHFFSGTVRLRRLKPGTHIDSRQMYRVYRNQAAAFICPFISSFFFLSHFQTLKIFVTFF